MFATYLFIFPKTLPTLPYLFTFAPMGKYTSYASGLLYLWKLQLRLRRPMRFYSPRVWSVVQLPFCFTHFVVAYHHHMEFDPVVDYCGHHM